MPQISSTIQSITPHITIIEHTLILIARKKLCKEFHHQLPGEVNDLSISIIHIFNASLAALSSSPSHHKGLQSDLENFNQIKSLPSSSTHQTITIKKLSLISPRLLAILCQPNQTSSTVQIIIKSSPAIRFHLHLTSCSFREIRATLDSQKRMASVPDDASPAAIWSLIYIDTL